MAIWSPLGMHPAAEAKQIRHMVSAAQAFSPVPCVSFDYGSPHEIWVKGSTSSPATVMSSESGPATLMLAW